MSFSIKTSEVIETLGKYKLHGLRRQHAKLETTENTPHTWIVSVKNPPAFSMLTIPCRVVGGEKRLPSKLSTWHNS